MRRPKRKLARGYTASRYWLDTGGSPSAWVPFEPAHTKHCHNVVASRGCKTIGTALAGRRTSPARLNAANAVNLERASSARGAEAAAGLRRRLGRWPQVRDLHLPVSSRVPTTLPLVAQQAAPTSVAAMAVVVVAADMAAAAEEEGAVAVELLSWLVTGLAPLVSTSTGASATRATNVA